MLVMIKAILYKRTVAVCSSMDFGKDLAKIWAWGDNNRWSRWRKETIWRQESVFRTQNIPN